ncbi:MAG: hypothetical protein ACYDD1_15490 [Caulobacteraceae bacterium]
MDRIKAEFIPDIFEAAARAEEFVERVVITLKRPGPRPVRRP